MRIDQLLNKLCLVKTRSIAKKACDNNLIKINDKIAKSSAKVSTNDIVEYSIFGNYFKLKVIDIPNGNVSKTKAPEFYEMIKKYKLDID